MTNLELVLNMLAETATTEISQNASRKIWMKIKKYARRRKCGWKCPKGH